MNNPIVVSLILKEKLLKEQQSAEYSTPEQTTPSLPSNHTSSLSAAMSSLMPNLDSFMLGESSNSSHASGALGELSGSRHGSVASMLRATAPVPVSVATQPQEQVINQQNLQQVCHDRRYVWIQYIIICRGICSYLYLIIYIYIQFSFKIYIHL